MNDLEGMLKDFLNVWGEVSGFMMPEFRPAINIKEDYVPYGTNIPMKALLFNEKYAAFVSFREYDFGADQMVCLEQIVPEESWRTRCESKGLNPAIISESMANNLYSTAFFLLDSFMGDWQDKLRAEGKK